MCIRDRNRCYSNSAHDYPWSHVGVTGVGCLATPTAASLKDTQTDATAKAPVDLCCARASNMQSGRTFGVLRMCSGCTVGALWAVG
eukprot:3332768-Alexandrium_andersonii.AAC.1